MFLSNSVPSLLVDCSHGRREFFQASTVLLDSCECESVIPIARVGDLCWAL